MRRARRFGLGTLVFTVLVTAPAWAQDAPSASQRLAATYSPVLSVQPQPKACGSGEAYRPTSVDIVLGRRDVLLRNPQGRS